MRLFGLCADSGQAVAGQRQVGQGRKRQVTHDSLSRQHLVTPQSERAFEFPEQHLDHPASLVDRHDLASRHMGFLGRDGHDVLPRIARPLARNTIATCTRMWP